MNTFTYLTYIILQPIHIFSLHQLNKNWFCCLQSKTMSAICYSIFFIADLLLYIYIPIPFILLLSSFLLFLFCTLPYQFFSKRNVLISLITLIFFTACEYIGYGIFKILCLISSNTDPVCILVIARLIQFLMAPNILRLFKNRQKYANFSNYTPIIYIIPVFSIWFMFYCYTTTPSFSPNDSLYIVFLFINLSLIVIMNIIAFVVFDKQAKQHNSEQENIALRNIVNMQLKEYNENKLSNDKILRLKHDIKNSLITILSYAETSDTKSIIKTINNELNIMDRNSNICSSGYYILDSIINIKANTASTNKITIIPNIVLEQPPAIEDVDLCVLIGNALDNAIEYLSSHCLNNKEIHISVWGDNVALTIKIENNVEEDIAIPENTLLATTKKEPDHGYGLISAQKIAEKYNGKILLNCSKNVFTFGTCLFYLA